MEKPASINQKIIKLQKELEEAQDKCKHKKKQMKMNKTGNVMWTCEECEKRLTYPTEAELNEYFKK